MTNRRQLMQGALASALGLTHLPNFAQTRLENLRIIVGFPPGGTTDAFSRRIAEKMRGTYANNVIVDNKPGAGGQIGARALRLRKPNHRGGDTNLGAEEDGDLFAHLGAVRLKVIAPIKRNE